MLCEGRQGKRGGPCLVLGAAHATHASVAGAGMGGDDEMAA